ncbi:MAG TPA: endolytic transglycosylase MltG [Geminicoccaceae bacterium]|nr:endolytic transglycosylase MltG [Geminicoccaceae bacterium]
MARWACRLLTVAGALLVVVAGTAGVGWYLAQDYLRSPGPLQAEAVVELPRGSGVAAIAARLAAAGTIEHPWAFVALARLTGRDRGLQAGEYAIQPGATPEAVMALLESGHVLLHPVAVPEGLTVHEVYGLLRASEVLAGDLPEPPPEGSLLPETYLVPRGEARARVVERMRAGMRAALEQLWADRDADLPLRTPEEALTLASIIEKETAKPEEYRLVAAVLINRLRRGMKLQTDPTVIYALADGKGALGRELTRADLALDHPYNTYAVEGLPPGPIANPGRAALAAALHPAPVNYLYFVADGNGGHAFAATLEEHNRNVARWRRLRRQAP